MQGSPNIRKNENVEIPTPFSLPSKKSKSKYNDSNRSQIPKPNLDVRSFTPTKKDAPRSPQLTPRRQGGTPQRSPASTPPPPRKYSIKDIPEIYETVKTNIRTKTTNCCTKRTFILWMIVLIFMSCLSYILNYVQDKENLFNTQKL